MGRLVARPRGLAAVRARHDLFLLVLLHAVALSIVSCGDGPTESRSDQAWVHILLTRADSTAFDTRIEARPFVPTAPGFPVEVRTEDGVADLFLAPGDYVFELPAIGFLTNDGDVLLEWESVIHLDPGEDRVIEARCSGVELELRDSVTEEPVALDEIRGSFYVYSDGNPRPVRPTATEHGVLFRELAVGSYERLVFVPADVSKYAATWFPGSLTHVDGFPLVIPPGTVQRRQFSLFPTGSVELTWSTPLPEDWTCRYSVRSEIGPGLASGAGDSVVVGGLTPGELIELQAQLTWTSPDGTATITSRAYVSEFLSVPGDTASRHLDFRSIEVRDTGCVDACPRYVRAYSGHPYHSESSTWWGAARDGAQLLFRAIETTRDVEIDTSMYGPFGLRTFWPGVVYQSDQEVVEVEPGETAVVWLDALAGGTLRGRVVGSDGESLPTSMLPSLSFEILHENRGAFDVSVSQLEPDGGFSISGVPPGACRVVARVRGPNSEYRDTWWPNGGSSDEGETLTVYDGDKIHDLEIRMQQR